MHLSNMTNQRTTSNGPLLTSIVIFVLIAVAATACGGGSDTAAAEGPLPTPTPLRPTIGGSPLDAIDTEQAANVTEVMNESADAISAPAVDPNAIDCAVHAQDPSLCTRGVVDGLEAIRFDKSLWSYVQDGFPVYTNVTEPYSIEHVVAATVEAARAELAGQNQALFPHLANRRTSPPYQDLGVWSVTFLFAADPATTPAQVKVAVEGTTAAGETVDELVTYLWQWTPERWIPEWERHQEPEPPAVPEPQPQEPATDSTENDADSTSEPADSSTDVGPGSEEPLLEQPPAGGSWCPPGFPYAHKNGKCYANPINPLDQVGGPPVTQPLPIKPGAPYIAPSND